MRVRRKRVFLAFLLCAGLRWTLAPGIGAFEIIEATETATVEAGMMLPTDVSFGHDGTLYVLDGYNGRIVSRAPGGGITVLETGADCVVNRPLGLTVHKKRIFVADTGNGRVCEFGDDGSCRRSIVISGKGDGEASRPKDIAIEGSVAVVSEGEQDRLLFFHYPDFKPLREITLVSDQAGKLNAPYLLDVFRDRVVVTDIMNGRIVQLTSEGTFIGALGERGVREGNFIRPKGVAYDRSGRIFVSDSTLGVVQVFGGALDYVGVVGTGGSPRHFQHPAGLAVHGDKLAVVEQRENKVTILTIRR